MLSIPCSRKTKISVITYRFTSTSMETTPGEQGLPTRPDGRASLPSCYSRAQVMNKLERNSHVTREQSSHRYGRQQRYWESCCPRARKTGCEPSDRLRLPS